MYSYIQTLQYLQCCNNVNELYSHGFVLYCNFFIELYKRYFGGFAAHLNI